MSACDGSEYDDPMRQTLFLMTSMAMDLVKKLRSLSSLHSAGRKVPQLAAYAFCFRPPYDKLSHEGFQVDFSEAINLARSLRNELNDRFLIVRSEEGSENKHFVPDLIRMVWLFFPPLFSLRGLPLVGVNRRFL